jgi:hypothetical protein
MAEIKSVQAAKITATTNRTKLNPNEAHGRIRLMFATLEAVHAAVPINDTLLFGTKYRTLPVLHLLPSTSVSARPRT